MTSIDTITKKFIKKIVKDVDYFLYDGSTEEETLEIINERTNDLFEMACDELESQLDQIDFNNKTDTDFNMDLTRTEIDVISDMMKLLYMREHIVKLRKFQTYLGTDINAWSPSNDRKTYLELMNDLEEKMDTKIDRCNSINRETGKPRSYFD